MKTVLLLMTGDRLSTPLIRYMALEGKRYSWKTCIASMFDPTVVDQLRSQNISADLTFISITDFRQCHHAIKKSDVVMAMVPDVMLLQIADSCISHRKPLVSPARLTKQLFQKRAAAEENRTLILAECGFSPGIDHVTAKNVIDTVHAKKGKIESFKTCSGSLVAETELAHPLAFQLSEPVLDSINMGKGLNRHLIENHLQQVHYHDLFNRAEEVAIPALNDLVVIAEGDSLYCKKVYGLNDARTVVKGRILRQGVSRLWRILVALGYTDSTTKLDLPDHRSLLGHLRSVVKFDPKESLEHSLRKQTGASLQDVEQLRWLGVFDDDWPNGRELTPAMLLQFLLERKTGMKPDDKDLIVMRHEIRYTAHEFDYDFTATLVAQGEDREHSALAKAIGLTTGAAAKAVLLDNIRLTGVHTPVVKEIYEPMLSELVDLGIAFQVDEKRTRRESRDVVMNTAE